MSFHMNEGYDIDIRIFFKGWCGVGDKLNLLIWNIQKKIYWIHI